MAAFFGLSKEDIHTLQEEKFLEIWVKGPHTIDRYASGRVV